MNNCYRWSKLQSCQRTFQNYKGVGMNEQSCAKSPDTLVSDGRRDAGEFSAPNPEA